jgi:dinuclear metal center YbgI/SA1388 family protein
MPSVADICTYLDTFAPPALAASWDNVGLLFGDPATEVKKVMTCLTVTPDSAAEAVAANASLIVSHHPILFQGAKRLTTKNPEGRMLWELARAGIAVYSPHTSFDNTRGGINDILAECLGLQDVVPLRKHTGQAECKIVVFVPESDLNPVSQALFAAGAGQIGEYSECSFRLTGTGTFRGSEASNPTIGEPLQLEEVPEIRLELVCPERLVSRAIAAMRKAHSYEEPAFDIYPLKAKPSALGEGRVGNLSGPQSFQQLAEATKKALQASFVQTVGDGNNQVRRVAIACGAAGDFLSDAQRQQADVFLTGEMRFHDLLRAQTLGISLLIPGHYATERIGVERLAQMLSAQWPGVAVWASEKEHDPLHTLV